MNRRIISDGDSVEADALVQRTAWSSTNDCLVADVIGIAGKLYCTSRSNWRSGFYVGQNMAGVHFSVLEIEDGFTVLYFQKPPEQSSMRLHCLLGVLQEWRVRYPARVISDIQIIKDRDIVRSICILWSLLATTSSQREYAFTVTKNVIEKYGSESPRAKNVIGSMASCR